MKTATVQKILLPYHSDIHLSPSVLVNDKITRAVQLMLESGLDHMVVIRNHKPIGMVKLQDALQVLGIEPVDRKRGLEKHVKLNC